MLQLQNEKKTLSCLILINREMTPTVLIVHSREGRSIQFCALSDGQPINMTYRHVRVQSSFHMVRTS